MQMIKVCHVTITHPVFDTRIFKKECKSLVTLGYELSLIAAHDKEEVVDGVRIVPVMKWKSMRERIIDVPKEAVRLATEIDADLYHFHDPELMSAMRRFARKTGKKVIWDAHENYGDTLSKLNSLKFYPLSWFAAKWFNRAEIKAGKRDFVGVVTITDKMAEKYRRVGIKTCVLSNYADTSTISYNGEAQLSTKPRLLSSGSHFRGRAVEEIAMSFALIRKETDAEVHFVGRFSEQTLYDKVEAILKTAEPEGGNWLVQGDVSYNHLVNEAIPEAWVGLVLFDITDPNNRNGLPNRLFECWANGLPVITTDHTQVASLVREVNGGLVIPENSPEEIAKAFIKLAKDRSLRDEMSRNGYEATSKQYNWHSNFKDLENFYKDILN